MPCGGKESEEIRKGRWDRLRGIGRGEKRGTKRKRLREGVKKGKNKRAEKKIQRRGIYEPDNKPAPDGDLDSIAIGRVCYVNRCVSITHERR